MEFFKLRLSPCKIKRFKPHDYKLDYSRIKNIIEIHDSATVVFSKKSQGSLYKSKNTALLVLEKKPLKPHLKSVAS